MCLVQFSYFYITKGRQIPDQVVAGIPGISSADHVCIESVECTPLIFALLLCNRRRSSSLIITSFDAVQTEVLKVILTEIK
jgi:hypothetical protein